MLAQRAEVSRLLSVGSLDEASRAYEQLIEKFGRHAVHREGQIDLANHLFRTGRRASAAIAYQLFIEKFDGDRELPRVRLLLALIHARDLNDPLRAKTLLGEVDDLSLDADLRAVKSTLAAELG
jgi:outer membrane protein assembly factor BamD (BamD/ComL family)